MGIGIVTGLEGSRVRVRFLRLQEDRAYTLRSSERAIERYGIRSGERVRYKDRALRVTQPVGQQEGLLLYELEDGTRVLENALVPEVRDIGARARLAALNLVHPEVVRARMQGLNLSLNWHRPGISAILGARALWLPHQIDVATRAIESERVRMLLADEVGLGKTVEAALIYAGLRHEGRADRVLILTPEALTIQWLGELFRKTHELLVLLDEERIDDALVDFPDLSPFEAHQRVVASIDLVANDPMLSEEAAGADWDLVIVDEAHHLRWRDEAGGNPAYNLVEGLAAKATHLLLLTATPMALDPAEYHALLRLLDPGRFDDPGSFGQVHERTKHIREAARALDQAVSEKREVTRPALEQARELLSDDPEDVAQLEAFEALKPASKKRPAQAESILRALRERHALADFVVRNRRGPVGGLPERRPHVVTLEPTEAQSHLIDVGEAVMFDLAETIEDPRDRHQTLGRLLRALWATPRALIDILKPIAVELTAEIAPYVAKVIAAPVDAGGLPIGDARLRWLVSHLREQEDKALVFVETDIAVRALRDALEPVLGQDIAVFHKGLAPRDQDRQVAWFRDPRGPQIMLSTEAGGEGRNFQFCNQVVLYDLPWRPATVEQRIGRVDRVGQDRDVHVWVPCFASGYEAAILKVMHESIGVLNETVGGIDHALEYVSDRLAELLLSGGGVNEWKALYLETQSLVSESRKRIADSVDPVLDHASFSPERVNTILNRVPENLEQRMESFVRGYADHSRLDVHTKSGSVVGVEGAPGAAGGADVDTAYNATFSRTHGLDHEEVEFLSFGHPLVEQAMEWARSAQETSAALAILRGFDRDGAVFVWRFGFDLPDDVPEASSYVEQHLFTLVLDESGKRVEALEDLFDSTRPLERMDPKPLQAAAERWRRLVEKNYEAAESTLRQTFGEEVKAAKKRLSQAIKKRIRDHERQNRRRLASLPAQSPAREVYQEDHAQTIRSLQQSAERINGALSKAQPRLLAAMAVRLVKTKHVSG